MERAASAPRVSVELLLWGGVLLAPLALLADITLGIVIARGSCEAGRLTRMHLMVLGCALVAAAGLACALRARRCDFGPEDASGTRRSRFMAEYGLWSSVFFLFAIAATEIPNVVLHPCD
jgi:hypothetical protein